MDVQTCKRRPIEVLHHVDVRVAGVRAWALGWDVPFVDDRDSDGRAICWLARLPGEVMRLVLEPLHAWELAALLVAGSPHLLAAALATNADLATDAIWWHMWNLTSPGRASCEPPCFINAHLALPPAGEDTKEWRERKEKGVDERRTRWIHGGAAFRIAPTTGWLHLYRPLAVDPAHPACIHEAEWEDAHTAFSRDPDGVSALALSCVRICTPRVYIDLALLATRSRACHVPREQQIYNRWMTPLGSNYEWLKTRDPLSFCQHVGNKEVMHDCHLDIVAQIISQRAYSGMTQIAWLARLPLRDQAEWGETGSHVVAGHLARAALVTDVLDRTRHHSCWSYPYTVRWGTDVTPLAVWLPAVAVALYRGQPAHARRLLAVGICGALLQLFVDDTKGGLRYAPVSRRIVGDLVAGRRPTDLGGQAAAADDDGGSTRRRPVCPFARATSETIVRAVLRDAWSWIATALDHMPLRVTVMTRAITERLAIDTLVAILRLLDAGATKIEALRVRCGATLARALPS